METPLPSVPRRPSRLLRVWSFLAHLHLLVSISNLSPGPTSVPYSILLFFTGERTRTELGKLLGYDRQLGKGPSQKLWAVQLAPQWHGKKSPLPHSSADIPCQPCTCMPCSGLSWVLVYFLLPILTFPNWCSIQLFWLRLWLSFSTTVRVASLGLGLWPCLI